MSNVTKIIFSSTLIIIIFINYKKKYTRIYILIIYVFSFCFDYSVYPFYAYFVYTIFFIFLLLIDI